LLLCSEGVPNAAPMNSLDARCLSHDYCYDRAGDDGRMLRDCDDQLLDDLRAMAPDPRAWPNPPTPGSEGDANRIRNDITKWFRVFGHW